MRRVTSNLSMDGTDDAVAAPQAAKADRNRCWRAENAPALAAYAQEVAQEGLALARFRSF